MGYKTHAEDFFPEKEYRLTSAPEANDIIRSVLWGRVRTKYKNRPKFWDEEVQNNIEIHSAVMERKDFGGNGQ